MSSPSADPRGAVLAIAVLTARRAGVPLELREYLDGMDATEIIGGLIEVALALLDDPTVDGAARLAQLGLAAAVRVHLGADG